MNAIIRIINRILRIKTPTEEASKGEEGFRWIDGEAEKGTGEEPKPMFYVGDEVQLYSPYNGEFFSKKWAPYEPERYEILEVMYDEEGKIFRYLLGGGGKDDTGDELWYSEEWLSLPTVTSFVRKKFNPGRDLTMKKEDLERIILGKALDDSARKTQIDALLDRMSVAKKNGKAEEVAEYKRQLQELVSS